MWSLVSYGLSYSDIARALQAANLAVGLIQPEIGSDYAYYGNGQPNAPIPQTPITLFC
jgi:hypothetical protein